LAAFGAVRSVLTLRDERPISLDQIHDHSYEFTAL
jgi:hypothetical protein